MSPIFLIIFLIVINTTLMAQADTLKSVAEYTLPYSSTGTSLNLAYRGSNFWISDRLAGSLFKIDNKGIHLDTFNIPKKTTSIVFAGDSLWMIQGDWLRKINKNTGQFTDSIKVEVPDIFKGAYECRDLCYLDSAIYSIWSWCWCGVNRFLKLDLRTRKTTDLGNIPLYDNLVTIKDSIWAGDNELYPIYTKNSMINPNRSLYLGNFNVTGLTYDSKNLWLIDHDNKKLKKMISSSSLETSIKKIIPGNGISVFPNPAFDYVIINIDDARPDYKLELFDITGKKIFSGRQETKINTLDLREVKPGIYMIRLSGSNQIVTRRIIKK